MLLVKTRIVKSRIHGIGLFAAENIKKGTVIWRFQEGFDFIIGKKGLKRLPKLARSFVLHYGYYNKTEGGYVICVDDARFFNHSAHPNTSDNKSETVANKNIKKGEEITCNYCEFDAEATKKIPY